MSKNTTNNQGIELNPMSNNISPLEEVIVAYLMATT
jgi:hypothetical protein